jgi:hypothetical protein
MTQIVRNKICKPYSCPTFGSSIFNDDLNGHSFFAYILSAVSFVLVAKYKERVTRWFLVARKLSLLADHRIALDNSLRHRVAPLHSAAIRGTVFNFGMLGAELGFKLIHGVLVDRV